MNKFKVCFVCKGNACRSPFAECVTRKLLENEGIQNVEVSSMGTLDWGKNPRDFMMTNIARKMGYCMTGETTHITRDALLAADLIIVFEMEHRNAITRVLDYSHWDRMVLFNKIALGMEGGIEDPSHKNELVYQRVVLQIENGCKNMVAEWKRNPPQSRDHG